MITLPPSNELYEILLGAHATEETVALCCCCCCRNVFYFALERSVSLLPLQFLDIILISFFKTALATIHSFSCFLAPIVDAHSKIPNFEYT